MNSCVFITESIGLSYAITGPQASDFVSLMALPSCDLVGYYSAIEVAAAIEKASALQVLFTHEEEKVRFDSYYDDKGFVMLLQAYQHLAYSSYRLRHGGKYGAHYLAYNQGSSMVHTHAEDLVFVTSGLGQVPDALLRVARSVNKGVLHVRVSKDDISLSKICV